MQQHIFVTKTFYRRLRNLLKTVVMEKNANLEQQLLYEDNLILRKIDTTKPKTQEKFQ